MAEQSLISRDYASAARLLDRELAAALENEQAEGQDRLLFLLANARLLGGDLARAEGDFERLERDYPSSRYRFLASYGKARCRAGASRFQEAADLYRTQVARLLSAERRKRLAEVYTGLAQKALAKDPVDYKGAISFLDLAVGLELPRQKAQELGLRAAKLAFEGKDYKGAVARFRGLVLELRGRVFEPVPGRPAWNERLWLARAWRRAGQIPEARRLLEDLLREGIPGEQAPSARYELALCFGVPKRGPVAARGVDELQRFLGAWPKHAKAPEVAYLLATSQANLGRLEEALETLALLIERYASSEQAADAMADRGLYLGRLERFDEAIAAWKTYLSSFPSHGKWMLAQRAIVELELAKADTLKREGKSKYAGAAELYEAFLRSHPLHKRAPGIHLTLGKMQEELEQYENARQLFERCAGKYPGSREASESAYRVGFLLESKLFNYPAALEAYRKVKGPFRGQALARLRVLEEKSLTLRTERVFRTDEKARVELVSRNIPKLRVRVYKLDLETFFRGTIGTGNIESLAIEVISPDASF
ncbi:MAG: tetratricopeptide repeat protein, partial [Planctomycetota bacterium]